MKTPCLFFLLVSCCFPTSAQSSLTQQAKPPFTGYVFRKAVSQTCDWSSVRGKALPQHQNNQAEDQASGVSPSVVKNCAVPFKKPGFRESLRPSFLMPASFSQSVVNGRKHWHGCIHVGRRVVHDWDRNAQ
jgi:hypothetical protein